MADISNVVANLQKVTDDLKDKKDKLNVAGLNKVVEDLRAALADLANIVKEQSVEKAVLEADLAKIVKEQSDEKAVLEDRTRQQGDELDDYKQKNLRGKFVITSTANKPTDVKKKEELAAAGGDIALS